MILLAQGKISKVCKWSGKSIGVVLVCEVRYMKTQQVYFLVKRFLKDSENHLSTMYVKNEDIFFLFWWGGEGGGFVLVSAE